MKKSLLAALLGAAVVAPFAAQAEGIYARANLGRSEYSAGGSVNETAWALGIGYDFDKNFGAELGYFNLGKTPSDTNLTIRQGDLEGSARAEVFYLAGVGNWQFTDEFSVFGKLGIAYDRVKANGTLITANNPPAPGSINESYTKPYVAVGVAYQFTKELAVSIDYNYFGKVTDADVRLSAWTAGLKYSF